MSSQLPIRYKRNSPPPPTEDTTSTSPDIEANVEPRSKLEAEAAKITPFPSLAPESSSNAEQMCNAPETLAPPSQLEEDPKPTTWTMSTPPDTLTTVASPSHPEEKPDAITPSPPPTGTTSTPPDTSTSVAPPS